MEGFVSILTGDIGGTNARFELKKVSKVYSICIIRNRLISLKEL